MQSAGWVDNGPDGADRCVDFKRQHGVAEPDWLTALMNLNQSSEPLLRSFPDGFRAIVVGATGAIGAAAVQILRAHPRCRECISLARSSDPAIDFEDEASIEQAAALIARGGDVHLVFDATGFLHDGAIMPEKSLKQIRSSSLQYSFLVNAVGPALLLKHFHPLLSRSHKCCFATLSARVGSIGDNALGGWYGYRSSKAALNMVIKTAAVELARIRPQAVCLALHPGTVKTSLSEPFASGRDLFSADASARMLLNVMDEADSSSSGSFLAYDGSEICW